MSNEDTLQNTVVSYVPSIAESFTSIHSTVDNFSPLLSMNIYFFDILLGKEIFCPLFWVLVFSMRWKMAKQSAQRQSVPVPLLRGRDTLQRIKVNDSIRCEIDFAHASRTPQMSCKIEFLRKLWWCILVVSLVSHFGIMQEWLYSGCYLWAWKNAEEEKNVRLLSQIVQVQSSTIITVKMIRTSALAQVTTLLYEIFN